MKKLKLSLSSINEMLTREQMKKISGGYDGPPRQVHCTGSCNNGNASSCDNYAIADSCSCDTITIEGATGTDYFCF